MWGNSTSKWVTLVYEYTYGMMRQRFRVTIIYKEFVMLKSVYCAKNTFQTVIKVQWFSASSKNFHIYNCKYLKTIKNNLWIAREVWHLFSDYRLRRTSLSIPENLETFTERRTRKHSDSKPASEIMLTKNSQKLPKR